MKITEKAGGKWDSILPGITGIAPIYFNKKNHACPMQGCGGKDRFRFIDKSGDGFWICNVCGSGNGFQFLMNYLGESFSGVAHRVDSFLGTDQKPIKIKKIIKEEFKRNQKAASTMESILAGCEKLSKGDPVTLYLKGRHLSSAPDTIYFHPGLFDVDSKQKYPAMVAKIHAPNGEVVALHRTFLQDNKKAPIDSPRKITTPITTIKGGAIRLWPCDEDCKSLAIAEGLETALAVREYFDFKIPVWAVLSAYGMQEFHPPIHVRKLGIYCDNDLNFVGQTAAYTLASKLFLGDFIGERSFQVYCPKYGGEDFLDEYIRSK